MRGRGGGRKPPPEVTTGSDGASLTRLTDGNVKELISVAAPIGAPIDQESITSSRHRTATPTTVPRYRSSDQRKSELELLIKQVDQAPPPCGLGGGVGGWDNKQEVELPELSPRLPAALHTPEKLCLRAACR